MIGHEKNPTFLSGFVQKIIYSVRMEMDITSNQQRWLMPQVNIMHNA